MRWEKTKLKNIYLVKKCCKRLYNLVRKFNKIIIFQTSLINPIFILNFYSKFFWAISNTWSITFIK